MGLTNQITLKLNRMRLNNPTSRTWPSQIETLPEKNHHQVTKSHDWAAAPMKWTMIIFFKFGGGCNNKQKYAKIINQNSASSVFLPVWMPQNEPSLSALGSETLIARWGSVPSHEGPQCHLELVSHASFVVERQQIATNSNKACNKAIPPSQDRNRTLN